MTGDPTGYPFPQKPAPTPCEAPIEQPAEPDTDEEETE